jgi:hypothetical protein
MELDNLKHIFLEHSSKPAVQQSATDLGRLLKRRSSSQVASLKKNLYAELIIAIVFCLLPVFILTAYRGQYLSALALIFFVVAVVFIWNITSLLKAIQRYQTAANAIKQHLQLLIDILKRFRRLYIISSMLVLPLFSGIAGLLIHLDNLQKDPLLYQRSSPYTTVMYILISILWAIAMYFFTRWYIEKLYGKHIKQLSAYIEELE